MTENVVGDQDAELDETMDEEEYAEFIAADPVQGAVTPTRARLLRRFIRRGKRRRRQMASTTTRFRRL